ncbi:MAG: hypothetical protein ACI9SP_000774 [Arenicella sp.]|jgi:hypothetical protein
MRHCLDNNIELAISAKMSQNLRNLIISRPESDWQPSIGRNGQARHGKLVCRVVHATADLESAFTVVVQRKRLGGQVYLAFDIDGEVVEEVIHGDCLYRAIAINRAELSNSGLIHWYNQRAEHSENRIKELKLDFSANQLPCGDFDANALYFSICILAYNLFVLMRVLLPEQWEACRATTIRWRLYALAAKVVRHGRSVTLKVTQSGFQLLAEILSRTRAFPFVA